MLSPGDKAPDFTLLDQHGDKVKLSGFKGRKVLVYFYPRGMTSRERAIFAGGVPVAP